MSSIFFFVYLIIKINKIIRSDDLVEGFISSIFYNIISLSISAFLKVHPHIQKHISCIIFLPRIMCRTRKNSASFGPANQFLCWPQRSLSPARLPGHNVAAARKRASTKLTRCDGKPTIVVGLCNWTAISIFAVEIDLDPHFHRFLLENTPKMINDHENVSSFLPGQR